MKKLFYLGLVLALLTGCGAKELVTTEEPVTAVSEETLSEEEVQELVNGIVEGTKKVETHEKNVARIELLGSIGKVLDLWISIEGDVEKLQSSETIAALSPLISDLEEKTNQFFEDYPADTVNSEGDSILVDAMLSGIDFAEKFNEAIANGDLELYLSLSSHVTEYINIVTPLMDIISEEQATIGEE